MTHAKDGNLAKPKARQQIPTAERNIYFYRAVVGPPTASPLPRFKHADVLSCIGALNFTIPGRYLDDREGSVLACWPDTQQTDRAAFGRIRRQDIPQLERMGKTRDLPLQSDEGVLEVIHMVFFSDNIVGAEFNFYGPRLPRFGQYIEQRAGSVHEQIEFQHILKQDVLRDLNKFEGLKMLELKINRTQTDIFRGYDDDLDGSLAAIKRLRTPESVAITLQAGRKRNSYLGQSLLRGLKRLIGQEPTYREVASIMRVSGRSTFSGEVEVLDLLKDQLVSRKAIVKKSRRARALNDKATYQSIEEAHAELRNDFRALDSIG